MRSSDRFDQMVKVHQVLGAAPERVRVPLRPAPKKLVYRLRDRARAVAASMIDQRKPKPDPQDAIDQQLDEHVLTPNRSHIVGRTLALERWLADHGFKGGQPVHFRRGHRVLHHHGEPHELPIARPVARADYQSVDRFLTTRVLDGIARQRPQSEQSGRVTVIPGFILLELAPAEFDEQFGIDAAAGAPRHGHVAIGTLDAGPVMVATRDVSGDMLAHVLTVELSHELASIGQFQHLHPLPTPGELLYFPHRIHAVDPRLLSPPSLDHAAEQLVGGRLRHLTQPCRSIGQHSLGDLGFTHHDWVPLSAAHQHGAPHRNVAVLHLASLLLARALVAALDDHAEARDELTVYPSAALAEVDCAEPWHRHATAYHHYLGFIRHAHEMGAQAMDELYRRLIDPELDYAHSYTSPNPLLRLHPFLAPLHSVT